jgi:predicted TPR repeat methyltransferase
MNDEPPVIDEKTRLNLQRMMKDNDVTENTDQIRQLKHSKLIRHDVKHMRELKKKYMRMSSDQFRQIATTQCNFLFNNYTNIFNRLLASELDYNIMYQFLDVLQAIEEGRIDQHQGSFQIGTLLKKLYIDSALKREEHLNERGNKVSYKKPANNISWDKFKMLNESTNNEESN